MEEVVLIPHLKRSYIKIRKQKIKDMKARTRADRRAVKESKKVEKSYKKKNRIKGDFKKPKHKGLEY